MREEVRNGAIEIIQSGGQRKRLHKVERMESQGQYGKSYILIIIRVLEEGETDSAEHTVEEITTEKLSNLLKDINVQISKLSKLQ